MWGRAAVIIFLALALIGADPAPDRSAWSEPQILGTTPNGGGASIAGSGANVYVAWGAGPVVIRRSSDSGMTFSAPAVLSSSGVIHETDSLAAEGGDVFAITFWRTGHKRDTCCDRELGDLVLHRSSDAGASWKTKQLTSSGAAFRVSIAVALPYVHVVWSDYRGDRWAIYYRRSTDGGRTWEAEQLLVPPARDGINRPQIAALGKAVHITWMDDRDGNGPCYTLPHCTETYTMRSLDAGATWGSLRRLTFNRPDKPLLSGRSDIAVFGNGSVFIAYDQDLDFGHAGVQHGLLSPDGGQTWAAPLRLGRAPEETHSAVAALGQNGVVAWFAQRSGRNLGVDIRLSQDSGRTWQSEELASLPNRPASTPHVAFTPGLLHLIWLEERGGAYDVIYRRRALGGAK